MRKLKKQGGFTLVEMLIVVAIIAILIAISIPLINSALDRAKHSTDAANERSAKAEAVINYLTETSDPSSGWYDAAAGRIVSDGTNIKGYSKHQSADDQVLYVSLDTDTGIVTMAWAAVPTNATDKVSTGLTSGICSAQTFPHS